VPFQLLIGLPLLASILVNEARQLQLAPLVRVMLALVVAWELVNNTIDPVLLK
jgi:hypothetical protein